MYEFDPLHDCRWTDFIDRHPRSSIFHTAGWLAALKKTHGFRPFALTTCSPGSALENAVLFCSIDSWITGRRIVSLPYSDHCEPLMQSDELDEFAGWVKSHCNLRSYKYAELRPVNGAQCRDFQPASRFAFHLLDISPPEDKLFASFDRKCMQNRIRHAAQQGLEYEHGRPDSLLAKWYTLVLLTRQRHKLPPQPLAWFRNLLACLGAAATVHILSKDGQPVAGIVALTHKRTVTCKYAASDQNFSSLGAMPLLFWNVMRAARNDGCEQLDFGRSDLDNEGLLKFKDRWGARRSDLVYWRYPETPARNDDQWHVRLAKSVFSRMPPSLLEASGRLLYRHFD